MSVRGGVASHGGRRLVPHHQPHLLVAHVDHTLREGLAGILRRAGYDVDEAGHFDEALAVLNKGDVDALVISFALPPDGCSSVLGACYGPLSTVVLGEPGDDVAGTVHDRRVQSVLTRPFPLRALLDAVEKATSKA